MFPNQMNTSVKFHKYLCFLLVGLRIFKFLSCAVFIIVICTGCASTVQLEFDKFSSSKNLTKNDKREITRLASIARFTDDDEKYINALDDLIIYGAAAKAAFPRVVRSDVKRHAGIRRIEKKHIRTIRPHDKGYGSWDRCWPHCRSRELYRTKVTLLPVTPEIKARNKIIKDKKSEARKALGPSREYTTEDLVAFLYPFMGIDDVLYSSPSLKGEIPEKAGTNWKNEFLSFGFCIDIFCDYYPRYRVAAIASLKKRVDEYDLIISMLKNEMIDANQIDESGATDDYYNYIISIFATSDAVLR